jgi:hypothetical protein
MKRTCLVITVCLGLSGAGAGTYSGGEGTETYPYKISTVGDWLELMAASGDWGKYFLLTADLNLVGVPLTPIALDTDSTEWNGFQGTPFSGEFEGGGHVIRNMVMYRPAEDYVGLFGCVTTDGQIRNLGVENAAITGRRNVGGLAAFLDTCSVTSCYATGSIVGTDSVGGLVGVNGKGSISSCWAATIVSGEMSVGGLVGENGVDEEDDSIVRSCLATGSATGLYHSVGGLVGQNTGYVISCYATGTASVYQAAGGLVGYNSNGKVIDCYSTGGSTGVIDTGGLCGYNYHNGMYLDTGNFWDLETSGIDTSAMGTGKTTAQMKTPAIFVSERWDFTDTWCLPYDEYPRLIWEKVYSGGDGTAGDPFKISTAADWRDLMVSSANWGKHFVLTADLDLEGMALAPIAPDWDASEWGGDFDGVVFSGNFDGQYHRIRNAVIHQPGSDYVGLFGRVGFWARIANLGIEDTTITGRVFVGGLAGWNGGIITGCFMTGEVSGEADTGGLVGINYDSGILTACHTTVSVSGNDDYAGGVAGENYGMLAACEANGSVTGGFQYVGGLAGYSEGTLNGCCSRVEVDGYWYVGGLVGWNSIGTLSNSYARGSVKGDSLVGGVAGVNDAGTIRNCYATGSLLSNGSIGGCVFGNEGVISSCFWDTLTTGQATSSGGEGKTTAEMKTLSTFTDAGWDFVGEAANGNADMWRMCADGADYPRLSWEYSREGDFTCPDGVQTEDLLYLTDLWMASTPEAAGVADLNGDGRVDLADFALFAEQWMR